MCLPDRSKTEDEKKRTSDGAAEKAEEDQKNAKRCGGMNCLTDKWAIFRFIGLCLLALLILVCAYGLRKKDSGDDDKG